LKSLFASAALALILAAPAFAEEAPMQSRHDSRVRYFNYRPDDVYPIWSMVGATIMIEFGPEESVPDGMVIAPDVWSEKEKRGGLEPSTQGNMLFLKSHACMIREPIQLVTKLPNGKLRPYTFEFHTIPDICPKPASPGMVAAMPISTTADPPAAQGNLPHVGRDALGAGANADYFIKFRYPLDEAAKRRAAARIAAEKAQKQETALLLQQQTDTFSANPWLGDRNYRYLARGDQSLTPSLVWDNGYSTAFTFPAMQRMPALFRVNPDGKEATSDYSVHGDTMIAPGTAQLWRLRDGQTVMDVLDLAYNPTGKTPGTGTVSPYVRRDVKAANGD
jgi:type IV secretion system protein VirB9